MRAAAQGMAFDESLHGSAAGVRREQQAIRYTIPVGLHAAVPIAALSSRLYARWSAAVDHFPPSNDCGTVSTTAAARGKPSICANHTAPNPGVIASPMRAPARTPGPIANATTSLS